MHTNKKPEWKYKATVLRVIDGDTMDFLVDLGFNLTHKIRVRIRDYDAPEMKEERGLAAQAMAMQLMPIGTTLTLRTYKDASIYNRYEADIELSDGKDFAQAMRDANLEKVKVNPTELEPT